MNFYNPLAGMTGYTKATDADVNTAMVDSARTNTALVRLEADRIKRMRDEEFLRTGREAIPDATLGTGTAPVEIANMPNAAAINQLSLARNAYEVPSPRVPAPAAAAAAAAPAADKPAADKPAAAPTRQVGPGQGGGWDSYRAPLTTEQMQTQMDRLALLKAPAAAADVVQAPMAGALNLGMGVVNGIRNFGNRVVNAVTGEPTLGTDYERESSFGYTPFYDKIRREEAKLKEYQRKALNLNKPNLASTAGIPAPDQAPTTAQATAQAPAPTPAGTGSAAVWDTNKTADKYAPIIQSAAAQYGVDPVVLRRLLGTESSFRPDAVSPDGASAGLGIAQIGAVHGMSDADRLDPNKAIPKAAEILAQYIREANGDVRAALLRYKGASSAKGKANMDPIVDSILSGTAQTQAPAQDEAPVDGAMAPASTQVAVSTAAPVAPNTPAFMFSPSQVGNTQAQAGEQLRLSRAKLAQLNRMLAVAPDAETMMKYQTAALTVQANMQDAVYRDATSRAARGDEAALASLAEAAGMAYAQTNQGFVQAAPDAEGNYRAVGKPVDRLTFVTNLYGTLSGQTAARAAELAKQMAGAQANVWEAQQKYATVDAPKAILEQRYNLQLEQIKGVNTLMGKEADSLKEMQKIILQNNLDPNKSGKFFKDDQNNVFFSTRDGILMYEPGKPMGDGMVGPGRMKMVPLG